MWHLCWPIDGYSALYLTDPLKHRYGGLHYMSFTWNLMLIQTDCGAAAIRFRQPYQCAPTDTSVRAAANWMPRHREIAWAADVPGRKLW